MSDKEIQKRIEAMKQATKETCVSKESALAFLVKVGIATKSGKLAKAYR